MNKKQQQYREEHPRPIMTQYLHGHQEVKITRAKYAETAVPNAVMHMQMGDYDAFTCQVWDESTGKLHAVIKRSVKGDLKILFQAKPIRGQ